MSLKSLLPIREQRPELREAADQLDHWLGSQRRQDIFTSRRVVRDLSDVLSHQEIFDTLQALRELGLVRVYYRVIDQQGGLVGKCYGTPDEIPHEASDAYGDVFEVDRTRIAQVFEFIK
ncbi:hypothetical protein [Allorhodopirellula solitaria]|uniref:Uncharacterized protein n=1 Tax=Allorhodopirellula solitaria TaxID=2527987 RepID=A0A5C5YD53_9BACT|nr:hypothetical protein [Allorhodopirellula solitaria]TWT73300.1 hypothetical protein CA85_17680 [Allorhodopirellula solitaria]